MRVKQLLKWPCNNLQISGMWLTTALIALFSGQGQSPAKERALCYFTPHHPATGRMACRGAAVAKIIFWTLRAAQKNVGSPRTAIWSCAVGNFAVNFACARHNFWFHMASDPAEPLQVLEDMLVAQLRGLSPCPCSLQASECTDPAGRPSRGSGRLPPWVGSSNLLDRRI